MRLRATQLILKKSCSGGELFATECMIYPALYLNFRPLALETNALPLDQSTILVKNNMPASFPLFASSAFTRKSHASTNQNIKFQQKDSTKGKVHNNTHGNKFPFSISIVDTEKFVTGKCSFKPSKSLQEKFYNY